MSQTRQAVTLHCQNGTDHGRITFTPIELSFDAGEVVIRATQASGESGEAEALNFIEGLPDKLKTAGIRHEAVTRCYGDCRRRIDTIRIPQTAAEPALS